MAQLQVGHDHRFFKDSVHDSNNHTKTTITTTTYLGDSVYCSFNGAEFQLYLNYGEGPHTHIVLVPEVAAKLFNFVTKCRQSPTQTSESQVRLS